MVNKVSSLETSAFDQFARTGGLPNAGLPRRPLLTRADSPPLPESPSGNHFPPLNDATPRLDSALMNQGTSVVPRVLSWQHPVGECPSINREDVVLVIAKARVIGGPLSMSGPGKSSKWTLVRKSSVDGTRTTADPDRVGSVLPGAHQWRISISCCVCVSVFSFLFFSFLSLSSPHPPVLFSALYCQYVIPI